MTTRAWAVLTLLASLATACGAGDATMREPLPFELPEHFPEPIVPAGNPLTAEAIELGRHLFYDERLSGPQTIACSSCHRPELAFADDRPGSVGATGDVGALNAPSLANAAYTSPLTWSHSDLRWVEDQLVLPMFGEAPVEMGMAGAEREVLARLRADPVYLRLYDRAFPGQDIDLELARLALASFVRSLVSGRSPFDAFLRGDATAISDSARRGSELFYSVELGCGKCHAGFAFTVAVRSVESEGPRVSPYHNIGLYNVDGAGSYPDAARGLYDTSGLARDMGRFRVPSLRNVAVTAPYMHDGSVATLDEVIAIYERGGREVAVGPNAGDGRDSPLRSAELPVFSLDEGQRQDLLAFLGSLTDDSFTREARFSNPW